MAAKGKPSGGNGKGIKTEHILLALAVAGAGYMFTRGKKQQMSAEPPAAEVETPTANNTIQTLPDNAPAVDVKAYQAELDGKRARLAAASILGLKSLELKEENGRFKVPFRFVPKKLWCQGGDLDSMKQAANDIAAKQILISLEPVSGGGKGDSVHTSVDQLYDGFSHVFQIKASSDPVSYALYICSDASGKSESCKGKVLTTHEKMSDEVATAARGQKKKDYIFYFQHLVLDKNKIETYKTTDFTSEFKGKVSEYLKDQKGVGSSDFANAWKVSEVIRSAPADVNDGKIVLSLPYNDPRCLNLPSGRPGKK